MGILFGRKKRTKKKRASKQEPKIATIETPAKAPFSIPRGNNNLKTYIYDGRPIKPWFPGASFTLTIQPQKRSMRSIYTGKSWSEGCALAAHGQLVGYMDGSWFSDKIKTLAKHYGYVSVTGECTRIDPGGWPIVFLKIPTANWFNSELNKIEKPKQRSSSHPGIDLSNQRKRLIWDLKAIANERALSEQKRWGDVEH